MQQKNNDEYSNREKIDFVIKVVSSAIVILIVLLALLFQEEASNVIDYIRTLVTKYLNWYFVLLASTFLLFSIWLIFGKYGKIVLG